jgi:hypothetical protein
MDLVSPKQTTSGSKQVIKTDCFISVKYISSPSTASSSKTDLISDKQTNLGKDKMTTQQTKATLIREYTKHITEMLEIEHLANTIREGMDTEINTGDIVISTRYYDAGVFVVDPLYKQVEKQKTHKNADGTKWVERWDEDGEELPNPYTEIVKDNDENSRSKSLSVKCKGGVGSREEKRVKVKKLCLMAWDSKKNQYPRQSGNIIFREREVDFRLIYGYELEYFTRFIERPADYQGIANDGRLEEARKMKAILEQLVKVPSFRCFYDEKYGFLIKRVIRMTQVVFAPASFGLGSKAGTDSLTTRIHMTSDIQTKINDDMKTKEDNFKAHIEKRDLAFGEELVAVAMNPDRVESIVAKFGVDAVEKTFG